jgi:glycosyltransferase involved in cell wall biosynthesis
MTVHYEALTSTDGEEQRRAWAALYEYAGVNCRKSIRFSARERPSSFADAVKKTVSSSNVEARGSPLVSVIVPGYNHAPFLDERIRSIVGQSYQNIEILLMDDCSPDGSRDILESWARKDPRISLLFNDENSGSPFHQWKIGADWASGKYLWIAESDDVAELDMLKLHVEALERNASAVIAYSQSTMIDQHGEEIGSWNVNYEKIFASSLRWRARFTVSGSSEVAERMVYSNTIPNASGTLIRKSAFDAAGLPEVTWRLNGDWLFYSRLLQHGDVEYFPEGRNKFRHHPQTQRVIANRSSSTYFEVVALLQIYENETWTDARSLLAARRQVAGWWVNSIFHLPLSIKNIRDNVQLYREFSRFESRIIRNIFFTFLRKAWRWTTRKSNDRCGELQRMPATGQCK